MQTCPDSSPWNKRLPGPNCPARASKSTDRDNEFLANLNSTKANESLAVPMTCSISFGLHRKSKTGLRRLTSIHAVANLEWTRNKVVLGAALRIGRRVTVQ